MVRASWLSLVLAVGCVLPDVALDDRPCPCAAGWVCDEANDVCVRSSDRDGGRAVDAGPSRDGAVLDGAIDGGIDGALLDGAVDAAVLDGAALDAPVIVDGGVELDAGVDAGAPDAGPPVDIVFEEDFESGTTSAWSYTDETDGTVRVVTSAAMAHGGSRFLRATTTANGGKAAIGVDLGRAITSGDVWVRLHFYGAASANYVSGITVGAVVACVARSSMLKARAPGIHRSVCRAGQRERTRWSMGRSCSRASSHAARTFARAIAKGSSGASRARMVARFTK